MVLFDNPSMVSIGDTKDELHVEMIDPSFFSDSDTGQTPEATKIIRKLSRMLDGKAFSETITASNAVL